MSPQAQPGANNRPSGANPAVRGAPKDTAAQAGRRLALITLVDRIADAVDLRALKTSPLDDDQLAQQIDRAAREQANAMRDEGEAPEGVDVEALVRDAVRELVGLGPIGMLLEDDEVAEIHCVRHDQVLALRAGQMGLAETSFTSEEALFRVIARLVHQSGEPWRAGEFVVERRLPRGAQMLAVVPPAASSHVLVIRRKRRVDMNLEEFVRAGALARGGAQFLEQALAARANILVVGPAAVPFVAGLAGSASPGERICVAHDVDEVNVAHAHMVALPLAGNVAKDEETVRAAAKIHADRLVVASLPVGAASAVIEVIAEGADGVLVAAHAPTLRQGLARFATRLILARPSLGVDAAREAIVEAFDLAIEVMALPDGRPRVVRIAELGGVDTKGMVVRDIFVSTGEGENAFNASGVVPRLASDLAARGIKLDPALFKKTR
jgi:pilus assembly protein CpaF